MQKEVRKERSQTVDLSEAREAPVALADLKATLISAGEVVRKWWDRPQASVLKKKDQSPLTLADRESNTFLRRRLSELLPGAGWLSEESEDDPKRLHQNWIWVVDPLDGTKEFVRRIPELSVSIGLVRANKVVMGGVYNPVTGEGGIGKWQGDSEFWGIPTILPCSQTLAAAMASVSRREVEDGSILPYLGLFRQTRVVGSVAYKLLRVAAGVEDLTFSVQGKWEWDICGGVGLLHSVGKIYHRWDGKPCAFNRRDPRIRSAAVAGPKILAHELAASIGDLAPCA